MRGTEFAEMAAFVAIAERRSFAKAADHLGLSPSTLSQSLRALEERLGVRLLNRTTRSVSLTEAGEQFLHRVRLPLDELQMASKEFRGAQQGPAGLLRLVVQPPVASMLIKPMLASFFETYPAIRVEISVVTMPTDIISGGFDAGIRLGEQIERDMVAICVMDEARFLVVASPKYLKNHAAPKTPKDLQNHNCIRHRLLNGAIFGWEFHKGNRTIQAVVDGNLVVDNIDLVIQAGLDGIGLSYVLHSYVALHISKGHLVPLLESWSPRLSGFFLYHPSRRQVSAPLRALIDFLKIESRRRGIDPIAAPRVSVHPNHRLVRKLHR